MKLFVAWALVSGFALAQQSTDEILAAEAKWAAAICSADIASLKDLLSDSLVYTHSVGTVATKQEFLRDLKADVGKIEYSERSVQTFEQVAVLTARTRFSGVSRGESYSNSVRLIHVWAKKDGRWQLVAHQSTFTPNK